MKKQHGFSLIEISIVMVIIAIMTGAIIGGQSMIHKAKLNNVIKDIELIKTSVNLFKEKYGNLPGDIPDAESIWSESTGNGNNNGKLDENPTRFYQHLSLAGLIPEAHASSELMKSSFKNGNYKPFFRTYNVYGHQGNQIIFSSFDLSGTGQNEPVINTPDAWWIDKKMDDGIGSAGDVMTLNAEDSSGTQILGCMNTTPNPDVYDLTNEDINCHMYFWLEPPGTWQ